MERTSPLQVPRINRSRSPSPNRDGRTLYFAYGDNLWTSQMTQRCPGAQLIGVARLRHWNWQINNRGIANIAQAPASPYSPATSRWLGPLMGGKEELRDDTERVYGTVWRLEKDDERMLDRFEDPATKETATVEFWARGQGGDGKVVPVDIKIARIQKVRVMFYADRSDVGRGKPTGPYLYKLNRGIQDALAEGIPESYVEEYIRPFLPEAAGEEQQALSLAIEDAVKKGVDVKKLLERAEQKLAVGEVQASL